MTDQAFTTTAIVPWTASRETDESALDRSARSLGDAARAFRQTANAPHDPEELARAFALIAAALDDLAVGAEHVAYATMEGSRRRRAGATDGLPLATARALSWRLHGLRSRLIAPRRICFEVTRVLENATSR